MIRAQRSHSHPHIPATRLSLLLLPFVGFVVGFSVMFSQVTMQITPRTASYLSLAVLAGIDSVTGGVRAGIEGKFQSDVFLSGFLVNTIVAVLLAYFGDVLGVQDVYLAAIIVLVGRIFLNISMVRRFILERARAARVALTAALSSDSTSSPTSLSEDDVA